MPLQDPRSTLYLATLVSEDAPVMSAPTSHAQVMPTKPRYSRVFLEPCQRKKHVPASLRAMIICPHQIVRPRRVRPRARSGRGRTSQGN